jgi:energy-coupling factor transport system substrate-specific component
MLGALMFCSKLIMEAIPNIHLLGMLTMVFTLVFRKKALFPIYIFVLLTGLYAGFSLWWIPHLYLWTVLWGAAMLLPRNLSPKIAPIVYMLLNAAHGFLYGVLYAPTQALLFGLDLQGMIAWIIAGLPFDLIHGISNFAFGALVVPVTRAVRLAERSIS